MTTFAKSFMIKRLILAGILGLVLGGFVLYTNWSEQTSNRAKQVDINSTELYKQVYIITFGDSLSSGYNLPQDSSFAAELEKLLQSEGYDVIVDNYSVNGATTQYGMNNVGDVIDAKPDIVIVEFGANDALKELSMENAQKNLIDIVCALKKANIKVLLAGLKPPDYLSSLAVDDEFFAVVANKEHVMFYPNFMHGVFDAPDNTKLLLHDKLHPSAEGTKIMASNIFPYVKVLLYDFIKDNNASNR